MSDTLSELLALLIILAVSAAAVGGPAKAWLPLGPNAAGRSATAGPPPLPLEPHTEPDPGRPSTLSGSTPGRPPTISGLHPSGPGLPSTLSGSRALAAIRAAHRLLPAFQSSSLPLFQSSTRRQHA